MVLGPLDTLEHPAPEFLAGYRVPFHPVWRLHPTETALSTRPGGVVETGTALLSHNISRHPICNTPGLPRQVQGPQVHEYRFLPLFYRFTRPGETRLANLLCSSGSNALHVLCVTF